MRKGILLFCLLICLGTAAHGDGFYDVSTIHTIQLTFPQSNWDAILDSLYAEGNEERLLGTAVIDGVTYDSVGVRYKGNSTYGKNRVKNPFNIKLDYVKGNQLIDGYGTLKLANSWSDPSFIREVLGYEIVRKYMPGCLANYTNVYVNGALIGLYVSVQDIDKKYLRTYFASGDNACFKGEYDGFPNSQTVWGYKGTDSTSYMAYYQMDSDAGWRDLIHFLDTLNNYSGAVESVLNVDRHLWMLAYDYLLVNLDSPVSMAHNFYLYQDDSHRFNPLIWDLNMDFGGFTNLVNGGGQLGIPQMQQLDPFVYQSNVYYPHIRFILSKATNQKRLIAHMKTMMAENFANGWYQTRGAEIQGIIASSVQADPYKFYSYANFQANLMATVSTPQQVVGIVPLMSARLTYLNNRTDFQATPPTIAAIAHTPSTIPANSSVTITAQITAGAAVTLGYRFGLSDHFEKTTMYDDGAHGDGATGDGVFGAILAAGTSDVHYYIYAENSSAGAFMPPRAEFEDSTITVVNPTVSDVVINEFMADNVSAVTDQDGEYEDWVELYNPTTAPVALKKCYLSDKLSNPGKWRLPDTVIAAHGFLTVWADQDTLQVGLHTNFALSKSGEAIGLADSNLVMIDSLTFGAQVTDSSYGRCPDGSGAFLRMGASFASANHCATPSCCAGTTGNVNGEGGVDLADLSALVSYLTGGGYVLSCSDEANINALGAVDLADLSALVSYLTGGGYVLPTCP
jgi:hypothetical protein